MKPLFNNNPYQLLTACHLQPYPTIYASIDRLSVLHFQSQIGIHIFIFFYKINGKYLKKFNSILFKWTLISWL